MTRNWSPWLLVTNALLTLGFTAAVSSRLEAVELARRISLGVQAQGVTDETQKRLELRTKRGVEIMAVIPNSTAEAAGVKSGDVLLAFDDKRFAGLPQFMAQVGALRSGTEIEIRLNRDGKEQTMKVLPKPLDFESSPDFEIEYGSVSTSVGSLRTVLTLPKAGQDLPSIVLLSGLGNAFVEHPMADPTGMKAIAHELTKKGFAVLRVDKPGCGDSQGGPSSDADFNSVVDGYVAGVKQLKQHPRLAKNRIALFGMSMGGVQAPLVAAQEPVHAIGIFGAMSCDWQEFLKATTQRQMKIGGANAAQIEEALAGQTDGWKHLIEEGLSPDDIANEYPELADWTEQTFAEGKSFSGVSYKFFQQLGKANALDAWKKFNGPVLSLWGDQDVVTLEADHKLVADIANSKKPGTGEFQVLNGVDHNLRSASGAGTPAAPPPVSGVVIDAIANWLRSTQPK